jgi:hypothetical protein
VLVALVCVLGLDSLLFGDVLVKFATSGYSGLVGYFQHMALTGVDITMIPPAEVDRIVKDATLRLLADYVALLLITGALFWTYRKLGKKLHSMRGQSPSGDGGRFHPFASG